MEATANKTKDAVVEEAKVEKKKKSFGEMFMNFLMMGGFILILIAAAGIFILVSYLTK